MRNAKKCLPFACKFEVSLHSYQAQPHPAQRRSKPQSIFTMREFRTRLGNTCKGGGVRKACTQIAVAMCLTVVLQQLFQCASTSGQCHLGGEVWAYTGSRQGPWTEGSMGRRRKSRKGNHTKPDLIGWKAASKSSKAMIDSVVTKRNRIWKACDTCFGHESHRPFQKPRKRGQEIHDGKDRNAWQSTGAAVKSGVLVVLLPLWQLCHLSEIEGFLSYTSTWQWCYLCNPNACHLFEKKNMCRSLTHSCCFPFNVKARRTLGGFCCKGFNYIYP